jgi:hypothetical protein
MTKPTKTFIVSGQHRVSGKLTAVSRPDAKAANTAAKQLMSAGFIKLQVVFV